MRWPCSVSAEAPVSVFSRLFPTENRTRIGNGVVVNLPSTRHPEPRSEPADTSAVRLIR